MKKKFVRLSLLAASLLAAGCTLIVPWMVVTGTTPLAFMTDQKATYGSFFLEPKTGNFDTLKITGEFPYARYLSFMIYGASRSQPFAILPDHGINPDAGNVNPYLPYTERDAKHRNYILYIVKKGIDTSKYENVMIIPESEDFINILMRIYRPDRGRNAIGGVPLPTVQVMSQDGRVIPPIYGLATDRQKLIDMIFKVDYEEAAIYDDIYDRDGIEFYHLTWEGGLPNGHIPYLNAALGGVGRGKNCKLAILHFRAPTFEASYEGGGVFTGDKDVRYYSFCTGNVKKGGVYDCLADDEITLNDDGTVTIVVYPKCLEDKAINSGLNLLYRGDSRHTAIAYRQIFAAADFAGHAARVPTLPFPLPSDIDLNDYKASRYLGDYAPTGRYYTAEEFETWLQNRQGL